LLCFSCGRGGGHGGFRNPSEAQCRWTEHWPGSRASATSSLARRRTGQRRSSSPRPPEIWYLARAAL
jgi:hypothetical protein